MAIQIIEHTKPEFEKAIEFFSRELLKLRTGQATPSLVEDVAVEVFGQKMSLKQLAAISCPERRQILIQPWDASYAKPIEKALTRESLGANPIVEKEYIRLQLPALTQEYREKLLRIVSEKKEEAKQGLRRLREEVWSQIQEQARGGEIREDDKFKAKDDLQKVVDQYTQKIEDLVNRKIKEITEV
ncbi:MAG: ribosome recycling factor [Candidatus Wildermuthbacteria bacterium]|nr:ribosome recycling factor [Candidatus Wildermuthbacteria bacterium]